MPITNEELTQTKDNFHQLISYLGLVADLEVAARNDAICLRVTTDEPGRLIGRKGQTLQALQYLLNGILLKRRSAFPRVIIDVKGTGGDERDIERQEPPKPDLSAQWRQQIVDAAKKVKRWGDPVSLPRMTPAETEAAARVIEEFPDVEFVPDGDPASGRHMLRLK